LGKTVHNTKELQRVCYIKASNVLLDSELNARLGDFGLDRLYDHGTDPHTAHVVGTVGYLDQGRSYNFTLRMTGTVGVRRLLQRKNIRGSQIYKFLIFL
jgi:hypothetical protein